MAAAWETDIVRDERARRQRRLDHCRAMVEAWTKHAEAAEFGAALRRDLYAIECDLEVKAIARIDTFLSALEKSHAA